MCTSCTWLFLNSSKIHPELAETVLTTGNRRSNNPWGEVYKPSPLTLLGFPTRSMSTVWLLIDAADNSNKFVKCTMRFKRISSWERNTIFILPNFTWEAHYTTPPSNIAYAPVYHLAPPQSPSTPYKPGGSFLMLTGSFSGRMTKQVQDPWGRWVLQEFAGQRGKLLVVVSASGGPNLWSLNNYFWCFIKKYLYISHI